MEFSVLMSVYGKDDPEYFMIALESVTKNQTMQPSQVVIIQDGPVPERVNEIITNIQDDSRNIEFTIIKETQNKGLAVALNIGIDACKYDWIARMDSDDIALPRRFEKQISFISQNPTVAIVGGFIEEFKKEPGDIKSVRRVGLIHQDIVKMAKSRTPMNHVTVLYRKNDVIASGKYSENFGKLEDYKLWIDMILSGVQFANIDEVLVLVRVGNGFIDRRSNPREIFDWDMLQRYLLDNKIIGFLTELKNMIFIRVFVYSPGWVKRIVYKLLLR